jgi:hypothetical protein
MNLTNDSNYQKILKKFKNNQENNWKEWLEFYKIFDKPGKQGLVGLLKLKNNNTDCVFKISQYINFLIEHESLVMKSLNDIDYCPHFCKFIGNIICDVDPKCRKEGNPFNNNSTYTIEKKVLLCDYIKDSYKFYNYIKANNKISEDVLFSIIKQVLLCITIAQHKKNFCHYDLHSNNIMIKKCNKDLVFLYVLDEENQFCVPTFGYYPVIIDFGFSYINDMDDNPLWPSLGHTDIGFMSNRFDWVADPKLFLVTVSDEMKEIRKSKKTKKFRRIVKNIFKPLKIDWYSGWDKYTKKSASDNVLKKLRRYTKHSELFNNYDHYCIDIIQSLIILPLEKQDYNNIGIYYQTFLNEWIKIENEISCCFYKLYILKGIINICRVLHPYYIDMNTRSYSIKEFEKELFIIINNVCKFCNPKDIKYEKMLCSVLLFAKSIEGMLYDDIEKQIEIKNNDYEKMFVKSVEQIYGSIEINITDNYEYNKNTNVFIINSKDENCDLYKIEDENIENINKIHPISRGTYIYDLYKK